MYGKFQDFLKTELQSIKDAGLYKSERIIVTRKMLKSNLPREKLY